MRRCGTDVCFVIKRGGHRTHLHFEAVDYESIVYLNGEKLGRTKGAVIHSRLTSRIHYSLGIPSDQSVIDQTAPSQTRNNHCSPKDLLHPRIRDLADRMVRRCSERYFRMVKMKPRIVEGTLCVLPTLEGEPLKAERIVVTVRDGDRMVGVADEALSVRIPDAKPVTRSPSLYDITMELFDGEELIDC